MRMLNNSQYIWIYVLDKKCVRVVDLFYSEILIFKFHNIIFIWFYVHFILTLNCSEYSIIFFNYGNLCILQCGAVHNDLKIFDSFSASMDFRLCLVFATIVYMVIGETPKGAISLDPVTFGQIVDGSKNVLVKFDKKHAYGDNENAVKEENIIKHTKF